MEFKNRRWWQLVLIVFGVAGLLLQLFLMTLPCGAKHTWAWIAINVLLLWVGTRPGKQR